MKRDHRTFSQQERDEIMSAVQRGLEVGKRVAVSAREWGITQAVYYRWVRERARGQEGPIAFVSVRKPEQEFIRPRKRFSSQERLQLIAEIQHRLKAGESVRGVTRALGISETCWYRWRREDEPVMALRSVEVLVPAAMPEPIASMATLSLSAPGGYRIEGLSIEDAARLLRALA